jgi:hypothetical protein
MLVHLMRRVRYPVSHSGVPSGYTQMGSAMRHLRNGRHDFGLVLASKVSQDLLLHRVFDLVDLFQPIDVLINLAGIASNVART